MKRPNIFNAFHFFYDDTWSMNKFSSRNCNKSLKNQSFLFVFFLFTHHSSYDDGMSKNQSITKEMTNDFLNDSWGGKQIFNMHKKFFFLYSFWYLNYVCYVFSFLFIINTNCTITKSNKNWNFILILMDLLLLILFQFTYTYCNISFWK